MSFAQFQQLYLEAQLTYLTDYFVRSRTYKPRQLTRLQVAQGYLEFRHSDAVRPIANTMCIVTTNNGTQGRLHHVKLGANAT
jgi:hypothetical protein